MKRGSLRPPIKRTRSRDKSAMRPNLKELNKALRERYGGTLEMIRGNGYYYFIGSTPKREYAGQEISSYPIYSIQQVENQKKLEGDVFYWIERDFYKADSPQYFKDLRMAYGSESDGHKYTQKERQEAHERLRSTGLSRE